MLKDVIKYGNEDVNQVVLDNKYDMLVAKFPTLRKDEQVAFVNYKVNNKLVRISEFMMDVEANVQDMVVTMRRKIGGKRTHVDVTSAHIDMSFHSETSSKKWEYIP